MTEHDLVITLTCGCVLGNSPDDPLCTVGRELLDKFKAEHRRWANEPGRGFIDQQPRTLRVAEAALDIHWEVYS